MPDNKGPPWLARLFWIAACGNVLLVLIPALDEWNHPQGEFSGLVVIGLAPWVTRPSCGRLRREAGRQLK